MVFPAFQDPGLRTFASGTTRNALQLRHVPGEYAPATVAGTV